MPARSRRHPTGTSGRPFGTFDTVVVAVVVAVAVVTGAWTLVLGTAAIGAAARSPRLGLVVLVLAGAAAWRGEAAWDDLRPDALGPFQGWATVTGDPQVFPERDPCRRRGRG